MMYSRSVVIVRPPSSNAPVIQAGVTTSRLFGAEDRAHRLLQHQRQAPGREQRLQRPAVEEADRPALDRDADDAGDEEGQRQRRSASDH